MNANTNSNPTEPHAAIKLGVDAPCPHHPKEQSRVLGIYLAGAALDQLGVDYAK